MKKKKTVGSPKQATNYSQNQWLRRTLQRVKERIKWVNKGRKCVTDHLYVSRSVVHSLSDHRDKYKKDNDVLKAMDGSRILLKK